MVQPASGYTAQPYNMPQIANYGQFGALQLPMQSVGFSQPTQNNNGFSNTPFQQGQYKFSSDEYNIGSKNLTPYETWLANNNAPTVLKDQNGQAKINEETGRLETRSFIDMSIQRWMMYIGRIMATKEVCGFLDKQVSASSGADVIAQAAKQQPSFFSRWFGNWFKSPSASLAHSQMLSPSAVKLAYAERLHYDTRLPKLLAGDFKGFFSVKGTVPPTGFFSHIRRSIDNMWMNNMMGRSYYESGPASVAGRVLPVLFLTNILTTFSSSYADSAKKGGNVFSNIISGLGGAAEELGKQFVAFKVADLFCAAAKFGLTKLIPTLAVSHPLAMVARFGAMAVGSILSYGLLNEGANRVKHYLGIGRPT